MRPVYDVLIVGGGTAGCVLASRLTQNAERTVALVEAGPYYEAGRLPPELRSGEVATYTHDWGYTATPDEFGIRRGQPRAKVVGGCSATNAGVALRGAPGDYDQWAQLTQDDGWSFASVLSYFKRLESDLDFSNDHHGTRGPIAIRRLVRAELSILSAAGLAAFEQAGHLTVDDHNDPDSTGAGVVPTNVIDQVRQSTALAYLIAAAGRPNLDVLSETLVQHVILRDGRAVGIRLAEAEGEIRARTVILAAGVFGSPMILQRSGIGAPDLLSRVGVRCQVALHGVGENLTDHPRTSVERPMNAASHSGPLYQVLLTNASVRQQGWDSLHFLGGSIHSDAPTWWLTAVLSKPQSRGRVKVLSLDPAAAPHIDLGLLAESADVDAMAEAYAVAIDVANQPALDHVSVGPELSGTEQMTKSQLRRHLRQTCRSAYHQVGTCRMGTSPDQADVVDSHCRVFGVEGLYVADASVMPEIPSANTHIPTVMLAERVSDLVVHHEV